MSLSIASAVVMNLTGPAASKRKPSQRLLLLAGWERLIEPSGHMVFHNYAFGVIAVDAAPRNCYINAGGLQPFDVVLCKPDAQLTTYFGI